MDGVGIIGAGSACGAPTIRRPYDTEAPIDDQFGADRPCDYGVGVVNRGRGMASPLRVRLGVRGDVGFIDLGRRMRRPYANQFSMGFSSWSTV